MKVPEGGLGLLGGRGFLRRISMVSFRSILYLCGARGLGRSVKAPQLQREEQMTLLGTIGGSIFGH